MLAGLNASGDGIALRGMGVKSTPDVHGTNTNQDRTNMDKRIRNMDTDSRSSMDTRKDKRPGIRPRCQLKRPPQISAPKRM